FPFTSLFRSRPGGGRRPRRAPLRPAAPRSARRPGHHPGELLPLQRRAGRRPAGRGDRGGAAVLPSRRAARARTGHPMALMKLVGRPVRRVEDPRFLRGRATYVDDVRLPGTLHVAFVRSPHAHARILAIDTRAALAPGAPLVHEEFGDNVVMRLTGGQGDVDAVFRDAAFVLRERFHTNRHCAHPMEGRATLARMEANGELTLWTSTQTPHLVRSRVADIMGWPEQRLRVIGPDVGGGFGLKCHVFPEEALTCWLALQMQ